jgi:hypothetical protein
VHAPYEALINVNFNATIAAETMVGREATGS